MFGFFKKTKDEKPKAKKEDNGEEEKRSTSKRDSLGRSKRLTLEMPKTPESPGKKSKKELKKSESVEPKSPKKLKTPESPGQKLKNKVLGSPLLRYRKEQKGAGVSFDDISESSVTDSSRSDDLKNNTGILDKNAPKFGCRQIDDQQMLASLDTNEKQSAGGTPGDFPKENSARENVKPPENILVPSHTESTTNGLEKSADTVSSTKSRIKEPSETANDKEEGTTKIQSDKSQPVQSPKQKASSHSLVANAPTSSSLAVITTSGIVTPVVTAESPSPEKVTQNPSPSKLNAINPSSAADKMQSTFLSTEAAKVPMKKCTTPEISASVENLKKEYLMEMINKESAIIELQMKVNQVEAMLKESNAKVQVLEDEKKVSMSRHHELSEVLEASRHETSSLADQLVKKSSTLSFLETSNHENARVVAELSAKCRSLDTQLLEKSQLINELEESLKGEREKNGKLELFEKLEAELKERDAYDVEREEEIRMLQEALEEALEEKNELEARLNMNASRETQLLEDFEWKLHEIERDYKNKISEAEASAAEKVRQELLEERKSILDERKRVEDQLKEVLHLKSYEAETVQLRGLVIEQQRAIRVAARQIEQLRNDERTLQDHVKKLKKNDEHHTKRVMLDEESIKKRLDDVRTEINTEWEDKFKRECQRLKVEFDAVHDEDKSLALESLRLQKDQELQDVKKSLESKQRDLLARFAELQDSLVLKDLNHNRQIEVIKAQCEKELTDVRKQLEKSTMAYEEQLAKLKSDHEYEIERLREECESRVGANIEFAVREKLERSKMELEKSYDEKVQTLTNQHQSQIWAIQSHVEDEKQDALTMLEEHYRGQLLMMQEHAQMLQKKVAESDAQWQTEIRRLRHIITTKEDMLEKAEAEAQLNLEIIDTQSTENHIVKTSLETARYELQQLKQLDEILKQENYKLKNDNTVLKQEMVTLLDVLNRERQDRHEEQQEWEVYRERRDAEPEWRSDDGLSSDSPPTGRGPGDGQSPSPTHNLSSKSCDNHVDIQVILEMQQVMADKEAELQRLTEEKRFYQLELIYWERNLANIRPGQPLSLEPYRCDSVRTFSAPPVTKPRIFRACESELNPHAAYSGDLLDGDFENFAQTVFSGSDESEGGFTTPVEESYRGFSL